MSVAGVAEKVVAGHAPDGEYVLLPVTGPGSPQVMPQVRPEDSHSLTRDGLDGLIRSIAEDGLQQAILVERRPDGTLVVLAGQRRLFAFRHGNAEGIDSPHFNGHIPAIVQEHDFDERQRDRAQLAENVHRADLTATEKGRMLWRERYRLMGERCRAAGHEPSPDLDGIANEADRCLALMSWRDSIPELSQVGASWEDCASMLGMNLSESSAKSLAKQFRDLGETLSERADVHNASHRAREAIRKVVNEYGEDEANAILDRLDAAVDGGFSSDSRAVEEAMKLRSSDPGLDIESIVDSVVTERLAAMPASARDEFNVSAEDGGTAIGTVNVNMGEQSNGKRKADVAALVRRASSVADQLDHQVKPHLAVLDEQVAAGFCVDDGDAKHLVNVAARLRDWADRLVDAATA